MTDMPQQTAPDDPGTDEVDVAYPSPHSTHHHLSLHAQLVRFILTGGLSAIVDFGLLNLLMYFGLGHTPAKACSFVAGTTTAYLINRRWTFRAPPSKRRFLAVVVLYGITFVVQVGLWTLLYAWLPRLGLNELWVRVLGFAIAQGVATTVNFIVQRAWIFRLRPTQEHAS